MQTVQGKTATSTQTGEQTTPLEKLFKEITEAKWSKGFVVTLNTKCKPLKILIKHTDLSISLSFPEMNGDGAYTMLPNLDQIKDRLRALLLGESLRIEQEEAELIKRRKANTEALVTFLTE